MWVCPIEIFLSMWIDRIKRRRFLGIFSQHEGYGMCVYVFLFYMYVMSAEKERDTVDVSDSS